MSRWLGFLGFGRKVVDMVWWVGRLQGSWCSNVRITINTESGHFGNVSAGEAALPESLAHSQKSKTKQLRLTMSAMSAKMDCTVQKSRVSCFWRSASFQHLACLKITTFVVPLHIACFASSSPGEEFFFLSGGYPIELIHSQVFLWFMV